MRPSGKSAKIHHSTDTTICPLCGKLNQCAMAANPKATECWCESVVFPKELLAQVSEDAAKKTCICRVCLEKYQDNSLLPKGEVK